VKRSLFSFGLILIFSFLTACSSDTAVELTDITTKIIKNKEITGSITITNDEEQTQELVPTTLFYELTIKNIGNTRLTNLDNENLNIKIQPHDSLIATSKEIIGFNIFDPSEYGDTGLGYGHTFARSIEPGQEEIFTLHYDLGVDEATAEVPFKVPSTEKMETLTEKALDATLIISLQDEEIARFDMKH